MKKPGKKIVSLIFTLIFIFNTSACSHAPASSKSEDDGVQAGTNISSEENLPESSEGTPSSGLAGDEIKLDGFKNADGEYQFNDLEWGISPEDVKAKYSIGSHPSTQDDDLGRSYFTFLRPEYLGEYYGDAELEFFDNRLAAVLYDFKTKEHTDEQFDIWFDEMVNIYGEPASCTEKPFLDSVITTNIWETDNTRLEIVKFLQNDTSKSSITIRTVSKEEVAHFKPGL